MMFTCGKNKDLDRMNWKLLMAFSTSTGPSPHGHPEEPTH